MTVRFWPGRPDDLPDLRAIVQSADPADLPEIAGELRAAELLCEVRLRAPVQTAPAVEGDGPSLDYLEAAAYLGISKSQMETLKNQGKVPFIRMPATDPGGRQRDGRGIAFLRADLDAFRRTYRIG